MRSSSRMGVIAKSIPQGCTHVWESGTWGVLIGGWRCVKCGQRSKAADFSCEAPDAQK